jgi:phosphoglycerate dehydrogenase-like enzyme
MKKGAGLVNIARGEVVDEAALIEALCDGTLKGAHLDALTQEPLPVDSPLWDMPNVIISPHNASASNGNEKRVAGMFLDNLGRWLRGEKLKNVQMFS